jgi:hypothetical protein
MTTQQEEHEAFQRNGCDRFEGFDRGDLDFDYAAAQQDDNEAFEAEMNAAIAAGNGHLYGR